MHAVVHGVVHVAVHVSVHAVMHAVVHVDVHAVMHAVVDASAHLLACIMLARSGVHARRSTARCARRWVILALGYDRLPSSVLVLRSMPLRLLLFRRLALGRSGALLRSVAWALSLSLCLAALMLGRPGTWQPCRHGGIWSVSIRWFFGQALRSALPGTLRYSGAQSLWRSLTPVLGAFQQSAALALSCPNMSHRARHSPPINHPGAQSLAPSATRLPWRSHTCNTFIRACMDYSCINAMMKSPIYSLIHSLTPPSMTDCVTA